MTISKYISLIPEYSTYHLLKCSSPYVEKWDTTKEIGKKEDCEKRGVLTEIVEGKCVSIDVEYFSEKYNPDQQRKIEVFVDENVLSRSRGLRTSLQSRYGSIKLSFQPKTVANNTISEIVINTSNFAGSELQTEVTFPVIIVKNRAYKLFKALLSAIGALFIALPGIIGDNQSYKRNIVLALIGIIIVGICSYWESREG